MLACFAEPPSGAMMETTREFDPRGTATPTTVGLSWGCPDVCREALSPSRGWEGTCPRSTCHWCRQRPCRGCRWTARRSNRYRWNSRLRCMSCHRCNRCRNPIRSCRSGTAPVRLHKSGRRPWSDSRGCRLVEPGERSVSHVFAEVVARVIVRRFDRLIVLVEARLVLRGLASQEAVEVLGSVSVGPAVLRAHVRRLGRRGVVPLAEGRGVVAVFL